MAVTAMKALLRVNFLALAIVLSAAAPGRATMPGKDPSLVLSAGLLMFAVADPSDKVSAPALNRPQSYVVVPAGQFMVVFRDRRHGDIKQRYLAVTETGLWGYLPKNQSGRIWYVEENPLREIYARLKAAESVESLLVTATHRLLLAQKVPVDFTRGELYEVVETLDEARRVKLPETKKADIAAAANRMGLDGYKVPDHADLPFERTVLVEVDRVLPENVTLAKAPPDRAGDLRKIYANFAQVRPMTVFQKRCDTTTTEVGYFGVGGEMGTTVDIAAEGGLVAWLRAKFGFVAKGSLKAEKTYQETTKLDGTKYRRAWVYAIESGKDKREINITWEKTCDQGPPVYGIDADEVIQFRVSDLKTQRPNLARLVEPDTGRAAVTCYADYLEVRRHIEKLAGGGADIFLTRFVRIDERDRFFGRCMAGG